MFDKEKFRENQELESTGYAVGHTHRELKERCLILMRFLEVRKVYSTGLTAEELAEEMDWIEELEIARELYSGIMSITHGKKLCCDYSRKVLDYGDSLMEGKTPVEILAPSGHKDDVTRARTLLGAMKYKTEEMDHPADGLSGGQRAKLLFLSMVLNGSNVLILDEPTRNFSPLSAPVIRQVLADFPGCIISVSHDRQYLTQVCDRVLELSESGLWQTHL